MRVVARTFPPEQRSLGNGVFTSGTSIGALIAPLTILGIAAALGWRWGFVIVGGFGAVWFLLWVLLTRDRALDPVWRPAPAGSAPWITYRQILSSPQFWRVFVVAILVNPCLYFNLNWLPTYFVQQRGLAANELAGILTIVYLGLDLGYLCSGAGVLLLARRGASLGTARTAVFLAGTVLLSASALVPFAQSLQQGVMLFVVSNFGAGLWIAMYLTMAQEVSSTHISTAAGLLGGSGSAAGALAMWAVGRVTHATGSFEAPLFGVGVAAVVAAIAGRSVVRNSTA
jgi:MFS transporter, ACS family, hexuronate transporter